MEALTRFKICFFPFYWHERFLTLSGPQVGEVGGKQNLPAQTLDFHIFLNKQDEATKIVDFVMHRRWCYHGNYSSTDNFPGNCPLLMINCIFLAENLTFLVHLSLLHSASVTSSAFLGISKQTFLDVLSACKSGKLLRQRGRGIRSPVPEGDVAALTRSSLICWENNTPNNKTMDPSPENNRAAWYQGPMKLEVVKSCRATRPRRPKKRGLKSWVKGRLHRQPLQRFCADLTFKGEGSRFSACS